MFSIRYAVPSDQAAIDALTQAAAQRLRRVYRPGAEVLSDPKSSISGLSRLVVECDGIVVGTLAYEPEGQILHLFGLMVAPDYQRQGVARRLIERAFELAIASDRRRVALRTVVQTGNVPIFERLGFRIVCEEPACRFEPVLPGPLTVAYMERAVR